MLPGVWVAGRRLVVVAGRRLAAVAERKQEAAAGRRLRTYANDDDDVVVGAAHKQLRCKAAGAGCSAY